MIGLILQFNTQCEDPENGMNKCGINVEMKGYRLGISDLRHHPLTRPLNLLVEGVEGFPKHCTDISDDLTTP